METVYVPISRYLEQPSSDCFFIPQELESLQGSLSARMEELKTVKKENRKRRKVIEAYQEMMSAGATGLHAVSYHCVEVIQKNSSGS